ncbi:60S ribosomal protein L12-1 [Camellia lanceoleosa]|uniref:60S ribosomal protein L12-1 n=1 Tax=Camellia lanceoleosa TaxID=1840588 RepID=A0ACC0IXR1_9ERIC|nr:60S ribosomal protein L12-1 [Camellia lanceoleosa]
MKPRSMAKDLKGTVKEILGTCVSVGCTVDGRNPKDLLQEIGDGDVENQSSCISHHINWSSCWLLPWEEEEEEKEKGRKMRGCRCWIWRWLVVSVRLRQWWPDSVAVAGYGKMGGGGVIKLVLAPTSFCAASDKAGVVADEAGAASMCADGASAAALCADRGERTTTGDERRTETANNGRRFTGLNNS